MLAYGEGKSGLCAALALCLTVCFVCVREGKVSCDCGVRAIMFEKTLQDVVKGIRAKKRDPSDYISSVIAEIKVELKTSDVFIKAQAVSKQADRGGRGVIDAIIVVIIIVLMFLFSFIICVN